MVLRYSGTENKLRLLIEYADGEAMEGLAQRILTVVAGEDSMLS
ncbi:MAG: hypothetical protein HC904_14180 [Blastochloris sp.]|nr:hypothetical protein [Blastochloris sp.]